MSITGGGQHPAGDIINLTSSTTRLAFCVWEELMGYLSSRNICQGVWENTAHGERRAKYCYPRTIFSHRGHSVVLPVIRCLTSISGSLWGLEVSLVIECLSRKHRTRVWSPSLETLE